MLVIAKRIAVVMLLGTVMTAQAAESPCLILKIHKKKASEALFRWTQPRPFDYVEGDFPAGVKFHYEVGDRTIREVKAKGGKVVVLKDEVTLAEREDARAQCKVQIAEVK